MAWTLTIYDETGTTVVDTITDADAIPRIDGGFRITVRSSGDCISMAFRGRNDLLRIYPRYILQFNADGHDLFWGPIVRAPNFSSRGAGPADPNASDLEEYVAEGGRTLVAEGASGPRYVEQGVDVGDLFKEFLFLYGHPIFTSDLTLIPTVGAVLTRYYRPNSQLDVVLDELVSTLPGWVWGVDAVGRVFLKELDGFLSFDASELLDFTYRPVDADDIVTKVTFVIAGSPAGRVPDAESNRDWLDTGTPSRYGDLTPHHFEYVRAPITFSYEHELHAYYQAERVFGLPEGINPFLEPEAAATRLGWVPPYWPSGLMTNGFTDLENIYDDDPTTFAYPTHNAAWVYWRTVAEQDASNILFKGFRLVYTGTLTNTLDRITRVTAALAVMEPKAAYYGNPNQWWYLRNLEYATELETVYHLRSVPADGFAEDSEPFESFYSVWPPSAHFYNINRPLDSQVRGAGADIWFQLEGNLNSSDVEAFRLFHFYPLILDEDVLTLTAKANIRVPRSMPGDAILKGYSPPVAVVEVNSILITGGLVDDAEVETGEIADSTVDLVDTIEYILTPEDGFLTRYVIGNDDISEAGVLLRKYVRENISNSNYNLMMATRQ